MPQAPILGLLNMIHGSAESSSLLGNQNIIHNTELCDGKHHVLSLSGYSRHLEIGTKMLSSSLKCLACFIKQHPLGGHPIEQFPTILGIGSYVWNPLQDISESGWDCFKVSPQPNASTLVEAMRTVCGPNPIPTPSPDIEMIFDALEVEEIAFTLVTNKKSKEKAKVSSSPPINSRSKISLVSRAPPIPKTVTASIASIPAVTCPSSAVAATIAPSLLSLKVLLHQFPWPPSLSPRLNHLLRLPKPTILLNKLLGLLLPHPMRTFCVYYSLKRPFLTFHRLPLFPYTRPAYVVQKLLKKALVTLLSLEYLK